MANSARDFTRGKLAKMEVSGASPKNLDRDNDAQSDDYGRASARGSDSSHFKRGGSVGGFGKRQHLGRPGRASGGAVSGNLIKTLRSEKETDDDNDRDVAPGRYDADEHDDEKVSARKRPSDGRISEGELTRSTMREGRAKGGRVGRSTGGQATATDEYTQAGRTMENEDASGKDRFTGGNYAPSRAKGGRIGRWKGGPSRDVLGQKDVYDTLAPDERPEGAFGPKDPLVKPLYDFDFGGFGQRGVGAPYGQGGVGSDETAEPASQARGGRVGRARGGRTGKGKTVVNVVIGGRDRQQQPPPPMPPPMPAPQRPPPPPPMPPPMPMAGGMPPGMMPPGAMPPGAGMGRPPMAAPPGAPMGPMGAPPGGMPMRARGGRIVEPGGHKDFGKGGHKDFGKGGHKNFGKGGTRGGPSVKEKAGAGSGLGRLEISKRQGAPY